MSERQKVLTPKVNGSILGKIGIIDHVSFARYERHIDNIVRQYARAIGEEKACEYIGSILNSVEERACREDRDPESNISDTIEYLAVAYAVIESRAQHKKIRSLRLAAGIVLAQMQDKLNDELIPGYERKIESWSIFP